MDEQDARTSATTEPKSGSYTVLARRYRSRNFDELVGQEPIARTLQNAVAAGRTAHAYLFCGSRGVGKTSMARILAKALNVTGGLAQAEEIAEAILRGDDLDVVEIDGASNRGVNEARDLISAAGLSPARCPYKIYIIDEVHMLTREAFNALLKTMEEPPSHVKFILCTTESHKVPATIQSRCQRFDFRLLSTAQIAAQLRHILDAEGIEADEQVVTHIARLGRGSMRDALSLLDRLIAAGDRTLTHELLEQMLGLPDQALASRIVEAIAQGDPAGGLEAAARLLERGASEDQALEVLMDHLRNLLLVVTCGAESDLVELSTEGRKAAARQAEGFDAAGLVHMIALCDAVSRNARGSTAARALFDAAIVRLCQAECFADATAILRGEAPAGTGGRAAPALPKKKEDPVAPPSGESTRDPAAPTADPDVLVEPKADVTDSVSRAQPQPGDEGEALWARVCSIASDSPNEHAIVEHLRYRSLKGTVLTLTIATPDDGLARWLSAQGESIADLVRRITSQKVSVRLEAGPRDARRPTAEESREKLAEAADLPLVRTAMEIFDANVVDVQEAPSTGKNAHKEETPAPAPEQSDDV